MGMSEHSEILVCGSSAIIIAILYFSPNKEHTYLTRGMDKEDLHRCLTFIGFDAACEMLLFIMLCFYIRTTRHIDIVAAGHAYLSNMKLHGAAFAAACSICIL